MTGADMMECVQFNSLQELEALLKDFKILFAYHSNKIENPNINYHDTREIFENGKVISFTGDLRTIYEISNQKDCYNILIKDILERKPITIELIKKIHYELTKGTYDEKRYNINNERPGEFKKHLYIIGKNEVGCEPEFVESELKDLLDEVNDYKGEDYLTVVSYFHAMFENIHPFSDGNGRVGRTLMNYYLLIHNIKPLIIYEEDKKFYYECLDKFDSLNDISSLREFIKYEQEKTWKKKGVCVKHSLESVLKQ